MVQLATGLGSGPQSTPQVSEPGTSYADWAGRENLSIACPATPGNQKGKLHWLLWSTQPRFIICKMRALDQVIISVPSEKHWASALIWVLWAVSVLGWHALPTSVYLTPSPPNQSSLLTSPFPLIVWPFSQASRFAILVSLFTPFFSYPSYPSFSYILWNLPL